MFKNFNKEPVFLTIAMGVFVIVTTSVLIYNEIIVKDFISNEKVEKANAAAGDNVRGFAWSDTIGWISFNSSDCDTDSNNFVDSGNCGGGNNSSIPVINYGVKIDKSNVSTLGNLSGYAWSESAGWISFSEADLSDYSFNSNCQTVSCTAANNCTACYSYADQKIYGWAKVLSLGDDGWIRLDDDTAVDSANYGVEYKDYTSKEFKGWAWNASNLNNETGIGWVSFNCENLICAGNSDSIIMDGDCYNKSTDDSCGVGNSGTCQNQCKVCKGGVNNGKEVCPDDTCSGGGTCVANNYKVTADINTPPVVSHLIAIPPADYCVENPVVRFSWDFNDTQDGAVQTGRTLKITRSDNTSIYNQYDITSDKYKNFILGVDNFTYGYSYNWEVTVRDSVGVDSSVVTGTIFTPPTNKYPKVFFTWYAPDPSVEEKIQFTGSGIYYTGTTPTDCPNDATCTYSWSTSGSPAGNIGSPSNSSTMIEFTTSGSNAQVSLSLTHGGKTCSFSTVLDVSQKLPTWIEE